MKIQVLLLIFQKKKKEIEDVVFDNENEYGVRV